MSKSTFRLLIFLLIAVMAFGLLSAVWEPDKPKGDNDNPDDTTVSSDVCEHGVDKLTDWIYYNSQKHVKNCVCGEKSIKIQGHIYKNGKCECGAVEPIIDDEESTECTHSDGYKWVSYNYLYHQKQCNTCKAYFGSMGAHIYDSDHNCEVCGTSCSHMLQTSGYCQYCGVMISDTPPQTHELYITYTIEHADGSSAILRTDKFVVEDGVPYYVEYPHIVGYRPECGLYSGVYTVTMDSAYDVNYIIDPNAAVPL